MKRAGGASVEALETLYRGDVVQDAFALRPVLYAFVRPPGRMMQGTVPLLAVLRVLWPYRSL